MSGQSKSLFGPIFGNAFHFIKNEARPNDRDPILRGSFPFSHTNLGRFFCDRLIWEYPDPELTFTFHMTGNCLTGSFNLPLPRCKKIT